MHEGDAARNDARIREERETRLFFYTLAIQWTKAHGRDLWDVTTEPGKMNAQAKIVYRRNEYYANALLDRDLLPYIHCGRGTVCVEVVHDAILGGAVVFNRFTEFEHFHAPLRCHRVFAAERVCPGMER
jgi:hypothetical protein